MQISLALNSSLGLLSFVFMLSEIVLKYKSMDSSMFLSVLVASKAFDYRY